MGSEKRMRVLFFLNIGLAKQTTSGHLITSIIRAVCEEGHTVHIIQKDAGGGLSPIPEELSEYNITTDCIKFANVDKSDFLRRYLNELKYINKAQKRMNPDFDAVFIQSTTVAGFAVRAIRRKIPNAIITFNVQDIFPYNLAYAGKVSIQSLKFKILATVQRYGYRHSNHIITISEDMKELLVEDGTESAKIEVIYNWSYQDEPYMNVDLLPVSHIFKPEYFNVVYAGNIGVMQNVDLLIEAAKLMKNDKYIWFHIIGNGVYKEKLEARAKDFGIKNISFWPMQPPELAPLLYSAADVNVIPLVKGVYRTALPSKTAICLACQKPIIFAIGADSKFGQKAMNEAGCLVVEADKKEELVEAIRLIQGERKCNIAGDFFLKYFKKTKNSKKYAEIILN